MNKSRKVIGAFCLWCDLLGYGAPFVETKWKFDSDRAIKNIERIERLQYFFTDISFYPIERCLVLNDGFVRTVDIVETNGQPQQYLDWFESILRRYNILNTVDKENNYPGARAVLTFGYRVQYMKSNVTAAHIVQTSPQKKKQLEKNIMVYSPKEFQMNTAFSKAYIMEGAGTKAGLKGSNLYIDKEFLAKLEFILTRDEYTYYLLADDFDDEPDESGWYQTKINRKYVEFQIRIEKTENYIVWIVEEVYKESSRAIFKLWFDSCVVKFNEKGIDTTLYKAVKYKHHFRGDEIIDIS